MKTLVIIITILLSLNTCISTDNDIESILISEVEKLPYMSWENIQLIQDTLFLELIDSLEFSQPYIESEQLLFIFRKTSNLKFDKTKVLKLKINFPNRPQTKSHKKTVNIKDVQHNVNIRYKNKLFTKITELLFYDRNSRYEEGSLILFNYVYGYMNDSIKKDIPYNENSFELFYKYSCNDELYKDSLLKMRSVIDSLPNTEYPSKILDKIMNIKEQLN